MTFDDAVKAVYARLDAFVGASLSSLPVRYENRLEVDLAKETDPFLTCEVVFSAGSQVSLGHTPVARYSGAVWLSRWAKEDTGTVAGWADLALLSTHFKARDFSGVRTSVPIPIPSRAQDGWHVQAVRVPFYFDDL